MRKAYLEPSAINYLVDAAFTAEQARLALSQRGLEPATGPHTIYELARTFLAETRSPRGMQLFRFLEELQPSFTPPSLVLMEQEILYLRTGSAVLPFLGQLDLASARMEIAKLARGNLDRQGSLFVGERERTIRTDYPETTKPFLDQVQAIRKSDPETIRALREFTGVVRFFDSKVPEMIVDMAFGKLSLPEATAIASGIDRFPAIRAGVMATMHLMWVGISQQATPARDKLDDFRHVIEGSYCSAFFSRDGTLLSKVPLLAPHLEAINIEEAMPTLRHQNG